MHGPIRFIAAEITQLIEKGSVLHAALGCVLGIVLAWGITWALYTGGAIDSWIAVGIALSLAAGLAGSVLGSRVPETHTPAGPSADIVNVWNLNKALAVPTLVLIFGSVFGVAIIADRTKGPTPPAWGWCLVAFSFLVAGIIGAFPVFGLQLGRTVRVRSFFRGREYDQSQIGRWGFEVSRGDYAKTPPLSTAPFLIQFHDGYSLYFSVSPAKAGQIAALLSRISPK